MTAEARPAPAAKPATPQDARRRGGRRRLAKGSVSRSSMLVLASTLAVGVANYGFSLAMVWILAAPAFAVVGSANSLLVVVGTAGAAALPWLVAREVARHPAGHPARRAAVSFAFVASLVVGLGATAAVVGVASSYAGPGVLAGLAVTTMALLVGSTGLGHLQGEGRFGVVAAIAVLEVSLKLGLGTALAAAGLGSSGAVAGAAAGAVALAVVGVRAMRHELALRGLRVHPELWVHLGGVGGIQIAVSVLTTLDVVVASVVDGATRGLAAYQAILVFARVPVFVATALSFVAYPRLTSEHDAHRVARQATAAYLLASAAVAAVVLGLPSGVLGAVLPSAYHHAFHLLGPLVLAGFAAGAVNLVTTYRQAEGAFRSTLPLLACGLVGLGVAEALAARSLTALAWTSAVGDLAVAGLLVAAGRARSRRPVAAGG